MFRIFTKLGSIPNKKSNLFSDKIKLKLKLNYTKYKYLG